MAGDNQPYTWGRDAKLNSHQATSGVEERVKFQRGVAWPASVTTLVLRNRHQRALYNCLQLPPA